MNSHFQKIQASKQRMRNVLQELPVREKMRLLDEMRERAVVLQNASNKASVLREEQAPYVSNQVPKS